MTWAEETMQLINKLTPNIKEKAFDPDWFLLRQPLEQFESQFNTIKEESEKVKKQLGNYGTSI